MFNLFNMGNTRGFYHNVNTYGRTVQIVPGASESVGRFPTFGVTWEFGARGQ